MAVAAISLATLRAPIYDAIMRRALGVLLACVGLAILASYLLTAKRGVGFHIIGRFYSDTFLWFVLGVVSLLVGVRLLKRVP